jgi:hypothetical protein
VPEILREKAYGELLRARYIHAGLDCLLFRWGVVDLVE